MSTQQSSVASKFYNIFWSDQNCMDIFSMHKEQLLEKQELEIAGRKKSYYLQRMVLSNSLKRVDSYKRIEQRISNRNIDINHSFESKSSKSIDENKISKYLDEKFGKAIVKIQNKLNGSNITQIRFLMEISRSLTSEKRIVKFLKKYDLIPHTITSFQELTTIVEKVFQGEIDKLFNSKHFGDLLTSIDDIADFYNNDIYDGLIEANKFYTDILYNKTNFQSRVETFDTLFECGMFIGGVFKTHYECTNCDVNVFCGNVTLNVTPGKIKLKCPNCGKEVFYLAPYKIHDDVFEHIISKDGLLFHAVKSLLSTKGIHFTENEKRGADIELDLVLYTKDKRIVTDIIEIKMFKTDRPDDTMISNIRQGLKSFLNARTKLIQMNRSNDKVGYHYLTNVDDEDILYLVKDDFRNELSESGVKIHSMESFKKFVSRMGFQL